MRCVTRVGHWRRCCTRARSSSVTAPRRSGSARILAAATASCTARLMPTPPTGDIAWAASPMHNRPGRYHRGRRSPCAGDELDVAPAPQLADALLEPRRQVEDDAAELGDVALPQLVGGALGDH